jgi:hypothetical protein
VYIYREDGYFGNEQSLGKRKIELCYSNENNAKWWKSIKLYTAMVKRPATTRDASAVNPPTIVVRSAPLEGFESVPVGVEP